MVSSLSYKEVESLHRGRLPDTDYELILSGKFDLLKDLWGSSEELSVFQSGPFLKVLETDGPESVSHVFGLILKRDGSLAARICLQLLDFDAEERLRHSHQHQEENNYLDQIAYATRRFLARQVRMKVIVMGSLLAAGPYGIHFSSDLSKYERQQLIHYLSRYFFESSYFDAGLLILKDLPAEMRLQGICSYRYPSFYEFTVQPTMVFRLDPGWQNFDDYIQALQSKYRVKTRKVLRQGEGLSFRSLDADGIRTYQADIYKLYQEVARGAGFNLVELKEDYFFQLKKALGTALDLVMVCHEERPIGFYSIVKDGDQIHGHFLGYSRSDNKTFELYHNILLQILQQGIRRGVREINFARTALEIKSSIGAVPEELYCYIAHKSKWINKMVPHILEFLKPKLEWTPRSPFR